VANMSDIAPRHAGVLFGLCNTFGSLAGILGVSGKLPGVVMLWGSEAHAVAFGYQSIERRAYAHMLCNVVILVRPSLQCVASCWRRRAASR
jgi:hypothetical protein